MIRTIISSLTAGDDVTIPPGDDCCAVRTDPDTDTELILTSDPVIENVHFDSTASPRQVGHKAAGRVLSDLAAMGAVPRWILLNIAVPIQSARCVTQVTEGAQSLASAFGASIVGGDVSSAQSLAVNAFACGTLPSGTAVRRCGATVGDKIFVTGTLGGAGAGKHLSFAPRVKEGIWLRENAFPKSMIDTSDGPATDLRHILKASSVAACLYAEGIPFSDSLSGLLPLSYRCDRALSDGEDFELLFTVDASRAHELSDRWKSTFETQITCIGKICASSEQISIVYPDGNTQPLKVKGFDHFDENNL